MNLNDIKSEISNCPTSPNCVSSLTESDEHKLDGISVKGTATSVYETLDDIVLGLDRSSVVDKSDNHRHYIFTSMIFRFKDDVWFHYDVDQQILHFKSQSRTGHSDLGVNKKRIEEIRSLVTN